MKNSKNFWAAALMVVTVLWGWSFVAIHQALEFMSASAFNTKDHPHKTVTNMRATAQKFFEFFMLL